MAMTVEMMRQCAAELIKLAAARSRMTVAQSRRGRRPMRVDTMLRKEKDGTLYKQAGAMGTTGSSDGAPSVLPFEEDRFAGLPAKLRKSRWEVPSVDGLPNRLDRVEGRDAAVTQVGPGVSSTGTAYTNSGY